MTTSYGGYMGKALWVDVGAQKARPYEISDRDRERFVGNKGLAAKILWDELQPGLDPLSAENLIVVSTSPVTGTGAPCSSRFNVSTKSPLTGGIMSSNSGGKFGTHLKRAGYDVLIIAGRAEQPTCIEVTAEGVRFVDARGMWGLDTEATQEALAHRYGRGVGKLVIGPAGENLVRFACLISDERASGRGGVGAVMGSKNVKAVVAWGNQRPTVRDEPGFRKAIQGWSKMLRAHPATGRNLPLYGTAGLVNLTNATSTLPTRNFQTGTFEGAESISGEALADQYLVRNEGCRSCPIRCARAVQINGKVVKGPEYETIGLLGANLGNDDLWSICEWNYQLDKLGMDTISMGGTLAFATELSERGMLKTDLRWGKTEGVPELIEKIAYRDGVGNTLAEGAMRLSEMYGGDEFSIHAKGMELAAYEPRRSIGQGLGYATAPRGGCHIQAGYLIYFENLGPITIHPTEAFGKAGLVILQQALMEAISTIGSCIFTSYAVLPGLEGQVSPMGVAARIFDKVMRSSGPLMGNLWKLPPWALPIHVPIIPHSKVVETATGMRARAGDFVAAGNRSFTMEHMFNVREGLVGSELPARLTEVEQVPGRPDTKVPLARLLKDYYALRGWDERGIPKPKTLKALDLEFSTSAVPDAGVAGFGLRREFVERRRSYEEAQAKRVAKQRASNRRRYGQREKAAEKADYAEKVAWAERVRVSRFFVDPAACKRCGLCAEACPVDAIDWQKKGIARIRQDDCIQCGRCYEACPPMFSAVEMRVDADVTAQKAAVLYRVDDDACKMCGICAKKCPVQCIAWAKKEKAVIDEARCVRCGQCFDVCPPKFDAVLRLATT